MKSKTNLREKRITMINNRINTVARLCVLLFFSVFVLFIDGYTNVTKVKYISFLILAVGFVCYYILEKGSLFLEKPIVKRIPITQKLPYIFIGLYLLFNIISCLFSPYINHLNINKQSVLIFGSGRYDGFLTLFLCSLLFVVFSFEKVFSKQLVNLISIVAFITVLIGVFQLLGFNVFDLYPGGNYFTYKKNFITTIGNIDIVSTYLVIVLGMLAFSHIGLSCKKVYSYFWLIVYGLGLIFLFEINVDSGKLAIILLLFFAFPILSLNKSFFLKLLNVFSISALCFGISCLIEFNGKGITFYTNNLVYIALASSAVVLFVKFLFLKIPESKFKKLWIYILTLEVMVLILALIYIINYKGDNETFFEFSQILKGNFSDDFGNERIGAWKYTLKLVKKRLVVGFGTGTYKVAITDFLKQTAPNFTKKTFDFAHNEYLQILYNSGILGFVSYMGFIVSLIINGFKNIQQNSNAMILSFVSVGYLFQAFFTFSIIIISPLFWIVLGMLMSEIKVEKNIS